MNINNLNKILHERWKFYVVGYTFGYVFSIIYEGVPNVLYLIPIKLSCIIYAIILGTALYYGSKKMMVFESMFKSIKYCIFVVVLMGLSVALEYFLSKVGIDITPFMGM